MEQPVIANSARVMPGAVILGEVTIEEGCGIWPNAVLRGDLGPIHIAQNTNIQDGCVLHCDIGGTITVGADVTVGHLCILHGCTIGENSLIGMGSLLMNEVKVGKNCLIGAGSLLTEGTEVPDGHLAFGRPAKVRRPLTEEEVAYIREGAVGYKDLLTEYE